MHAIQCDETTFRLFFEFKSSANKEEKNGSHRLSADIAAIVVVENKLGLNKEIKRL